MFIKVITKTCAYFIFSFLCIVSNQQLRDTSTVLNASNYSKSNDHLLAKVWSAVYVPYGIDPCEFYRIIPICFYISLQHRGNNFLGSLVFCRKRKAIKTLRRSGVFYKVYHRNILFRCTEPIIALKLLEKSS